MSADDAARSASLEVSRSGYDGLSVRVHAADGAFYSYHLYRGAELAESTPYVRKDAHTFGRLAPGAYRCRVFVRTAAEERYVVSGDRIVLDGGPSADTAPIPDPAAGEPDPRWARPEDLPRDSDYGRFLPAVTLWPSVDAFVAADDWVPGVNVVQLPSGLHIDLYLGGDASTVPEGRAIPVIFSGAVSKRDGNPGPFFSGIGLGKGLRSPFVAISDATLNADRSLTLSWYAGRRGDHLQLATLAVLTAVARRYDRELVLVGGSGGGFASLYNAARLEVPVSAFVWNPQTDLLDYQPRVVAEYLTHALPADGVEVARLSREQRSEALRAGGVEHRVLTDGPPPGRRRVLYLQNAGDAHVIDHLAPFVEQGGLRHMGGGRYVDDEGVLVLVSAFSEGHDPPPRDVLVEGLREMLDTSRSAVDIVDSLQHRQLLPSTGLDSLPRDLRGEVERLRAAVSLRATRDESGQLWAALVWDGLPNRYGGISTAFDFSGVDEPFSRSHRQNAVLVKDAEARVAHVRARVRDGHLNELFSLDADVTPIPARLRTFVVGSCVSRDTFAFLDPTFFELTGYVARQSLVSAFGPPTAPPVDPSTLPSAFQRRMLEADAGSSLPTALRQAADEVDLVLWDLVDERLGVLDHAGGGVSTDSVELRTQLTDGLPDGLSHVPFGTPEHLDRFGAALAPWRDLLSELGLLDRTVLVAPPWATSSETGEPTPTSFGLGAEEANGFTEDYIARAQQVLGVPAVGRALPDVHALSSHQWGLAPFHYDDWTYERLANEISAVAEQLVHPFGWDPADPHGRTRFPTVAQRAPLGRSQAPEVTLVQTGALEVTATVSARQLDACAFSLHAGGQRLALTPYQRGLTYTFTVPKPDIYRCRAFVLRTDGERIPVASSPLRVV